MRWQSRAAKACVLPNISLFPTIHLLLRLRDLAGCCNALRQRIEYGDVYCNLNGSSELQRLHERRAEAPPPQQPNCVTLGKAIEAIPLLTMGSRRSEAHYLRLGP